MEMNYEMLIDVISSIGIITSILYGARQIEMAKSSNTLSSILYIQKENFEVRKKLINSTNQIEPLLRKINENNTNFVSLYSKDEYNDIREFGYHYELIGLLVKNKSLKFNTVFELIPFPDDFWDRTEELRTLVRYNYISDYWNNFEYLKELYTKRREKLR